MRIEINLVPDVKQELIRAQRARTMVIFACVAVGIASIALVVLLLMWAGYQNVRGSMYDNAIKDESAKLANVEDIESSLTIQNQLNTLPVLHEDKLASSRIFDVVAAISPAAPNEIKVSKVTINSDNKTIAIEAESEGGYSALEAFKKTLSVTELRFTNENGDEESHLLALEISDGDRSYGENSAGDVSLRFTVTFEYPEVLFRPYLNKARLVGPNKNTDVTDSSLGIPKSLFSSRSSSPDEGGS